MNTRIAFGAAVLLLSMYTLTSARESYKDVAVVINTNSTVSESIGTYFAAQRLLPSQNVIRISVPTTEEITNTQFVDLRTQIESYLTSHNLSDSINYIVTTKGMPLKVNRGSTFDPNSPCASVESELCLILGPYASQIGQAGRIVSPFAFCQQNFSRAAFGIYLVTRLDGFTYSDVKAMIDRSASADSTELSTGRFVFDADPTYGLAQGSLNGNMSSASTALASRSRLTVLDQSTTYLTNLPNVLGYVSWGSNDQNANATSTHAIPNHQFMPGSIAETYVSTSARSFEPGTIYGQSLVADLLAEGVCGVKGYVYEPYSSAMAYVQYAFPMYVDGYTLAESIYSSSLYLSWMDVVVGDPKMRIRTVRVPQADLLTDSGNGTGLLPVELVSFTGAQTPTGSVRLEWATATEVNNYGFEVERNTQGTWQKMGFVEGAGTSNTRHAYAFVDRPVSSSSGTCSYRLKQIDRDGRVEYSKTVQVACASASVNEFRLNANYPNPFNPSTAVSFTVATSGHATLKVYNTLGQEVAVLFNGVAEAGVLQTATFNASAQSSGVYFSVLEADGRRMVQRMMLSK